MNLQKDKISVCIPTYNGEKYIEKQLKSILTQLRNYDEVIISDDSSTDSTLATVKKMNDIRIKIYSNNTFHSPIFNLENAIKKATGDYIFLSDQDDIWHPDKVKTMLSYLQDYNTVVSDCFIINESDEIIEESFFALNESRKGLIKNFIKNSYLGCCMAFDRKILQASLPFPRHIAMHDIWLGIISEIVGNPIFINSKLLYYRRHLNNFSPTAEKSKFSLIFKIRYRISYGISAIVRSVKLFLK